MHDSRNGNGDRTSGQIDYDLHGFVGIRLLHATAKDAAAVAGQLGLPPVTLSREPDIVIRFVEDLPVTSPLRCLGVGDAAFTDDAFLILRARHKTRAKVQIPFERIGRACEIVCESGLPGVPLLIEILNMTMLAKGVIPIHASAFAYDGVGVLAVGWSQGGKTEALLAMMAQGAQYVGDEWVYVSRDGRTMYGIPQPIRVWDWHLQDMPAYKNRVGIGALLRLRALKAARFLGRTLSRGIAGRLMPVGTLNRFVALLDRQLNVDVSPSQLFGPEHGVKAATFDRLLLVVSHDLPGVMVEPVDPGEVARRMVSSLREERSRLMSYYQKFLFAFPGRVNPLLEQADEIHGLMLSRVFAGKPAYAIYHPYPMRLSCMFDTIRSLCRGGNRQEAAGRAGRAPVWTGPSKGGTP